MHIVTAAQMREMDAATITTFGLPGRVLMENAGRGATQILFERFPGIVEMKVGVMAGRGNNGGDGFVIARYLGQKGTPVTVFLLTAHETLQGDAAANYQLLSSLSIPIIEIPDAETFAKHLTLMRHQDLWVDAILGTGLMADVKPFFKTAIDFINESRKPVLAVDIPSGLSSDTGRPCGTSIKATLTATFAFPKIGHMLYPGVDYTGRLEIIDIGIPPHIVAQVAPKQHLSTAEIIRTSLPNRATDAHKGATGHLLVVAGGLGKTGAAAMTAGSALRAGAGLVTLAIPKTLISILESLIVEAMTYPLPEIEPGALGETAESDILQALIGKKCLAIGPGIGTAETTRRLMQTLLPEVDIPMVIDADGLNCLGESPEILSRLKAETILTPHPGEMARLAGITTREVQEDRIGCARSFAERFRTHVVLKGAHTVIAFPNGEVFINPTGNAGMATGGMGDVLTGVIAGFIAQGLSPASAALAGVYLHGAAADTLEKTIGPIGYLAGEVMAAIPKEITEIRRQEILAYPNWPIPRNPLGANLCVRPLVSRTNTKVRPYHADDKSKIRIP
jgi:ADP-dependent NAD(P)H-hydrate dehydratase / NAD(P)H-hydrate epimerase